MKQQSLAMAADGNFDKFHKRTRRELFLSEMDQIVPWSKLVELIEPHYPNSATGRPPVGVERMLRIYFLQQWFNLSDAAAEESLYDSPGMRRFVGIDLGRERVPDETTLCKFRHLLEKHELGGEILDAVNGHLHDKGIRIATGTIVDATILHAPSSTRNSTGQRDPEMHQTRKGNQWYFGLKAHVGVDSKTRLVPSVATSAASVSDCHLLPDLRHGEERKVWGDAAYQGQREAMRQAAPQAQDMTNRRTKYKNYVDQAQRSKNTTKSRVRARVEHVFRVLKRQFGFYRGIAKNHNRLCAAFALVNLYHHRKRLIVQGA